MQEHTCLGYTVNGDHCLEKLYGTKKFCHKHDPEYTTQTRMPDEKFLIKKFTCTYIYEDNESKICGNKGLQGLDRCYLHYNGEIKKCRRCDKERKMRKMAHCNHDLCVCCFVEVDECPTCHSCHKCKLPKRTVKIPKDQRDLIDSVFRTFEQVKTDNQRAKVSRVMQTLVTPYADIDCPCCEIISEREN